MIINPHEQHRERLRKMFLYCNPERLPDHMRLEFLLCYSIPRIDTNPLAHELIRRFGSLENVLDAEVEELMNVEGGLLRNIIIGVLGSFVGSFVFGLIGFSAHGLVADLIVGIVGACLFIWLARKILK